MYSINGLKQGVVIDLGGTPYLVLDSKHLKMGRGGAIVQTKLKSLITGGLLERNFRGAEKIKEAKIEQKIFQFLYQQKDSYFFMNSVTFEQIEISESKISKTKNFLKEGSSYDIFFFQGEPIDIEIPIKVDFKITRTEPAVKGNTVSQATKKATIETGFVLSVPLFIKEGDLIKIDTRTGVYLERSK